MNIPAQIFGILAIIVWTLGLMQKKKKEIAFFQTISNILYCIQYFLLQAFSASGMNLISSIRCGIIYFDEKKKKKTKLTVFIASYLIILGITALTYNNIMSLVPALITLLYTYSLYQNNVRTTYTIIVICAFIWIIYNAYVGAYISVSGNIVEIIFGIRSIIKSKKVSLQ